MASDEILWQVIGHQFCSHRLKLDTKTQTFCRNEHNLTGFCNRQSCPLANSRYATIRSAPQTESLYLYIKTPERVHLPSQWWEKIRLPSNYEKALAVIDEKLLYWNKFTIHKCKQRLTRLTQVAIRARRIAKEEVRLGEKLVPKLASKVKRREQTRERKAESAAKVEREIERELIERLRSGVYGDRPLNVEEGLWRKVLRGLERAEKGEDVELEDEEEDEDEKELDVEYVSEIEDGESVLGEMEDFDDWFDGESADETEDSRDGESDEDNSGADDDDAGEDDTPAAGEKRKRTSAPPSKSRKKRAARDRPQKMIEYETEAPPQRLALA